MDFTSERAPIEDTLPSEDDAKVDDVVVVEPAAKSVERALLAKEEGNGCAIL